MRTQAVIGLLTAWALWGGDPGHVYYERLAKPELDVFTNSPSTTQQQWFRSHFAQMIVFSPYFDTRTRWYPNALVYIDLYGIPRESPLAREHSDWVLRDAHGNRLYIPWGCQGGTCPQYAADVASPAFRAWWIKQAKSTLSHGYSGIFVDDVNLEYRVSDGNERQAAPIDSSTGQPMSWEAWRNHVADFVEQIRKAFPNVEIVHNSIWFAGPPGVRDADPAIQRQINAANNINIERGIANDLHLTGGSGEWSVHELFAFIDRIHARGRSVTLEEYELDSAKREYALAGYFLISSGDDRLADTITTPANWWTGYDTELGKPLGPRTYENGVFQRKFSCGLALLGEPGLSSTRISLNAPFTTSDGRVVRSVDLSSRQGMVLRSCPSEAAPNSHTPDGVVH